MASGDADIDIDLDDDGGRDDDDSRKEADKRAKVLHEEEQDALDKNEKAIKDMQETSKKLTDVLTKMQEDAKVTKGTYAKEGGKMVAAALVFTGVGLAVKEIVEASKGSDSGSGGDGGSSADTQAKIKAANVSIKLGDFLKLMYQKLLDIGKWETANSTKTVTTSGGIDLGVSGFFKSNLTDKISKVS